MIVHKHNFKGTNAYCVSYLRSIRKIVEGKETHPYSDVRDDQCCICYFEGEKACEVPDKKE